MASFNMQSHAYAKNILKVADILASLSPTIISWYSLYSKKIKDFGDLSGIDMIYFVSICDPVKEWMFTINKLKTNCLNDIRKLNNSPKNVRFNAINQLLSSKEYIQNNLKIIKILTQNNCKEWESVVNKLDLVDSQFPNVNKKYWEMFKYFCGGSASEHCSNTHIVCNRNTINVLMHYQNIDNNSALLCRHVKFGDLVDALIKILEIALDNINEVENEIKYLVYSGHFMNEESSLLATLPTELIGKINDNISK